MKRGRGSGDDGSDRRDPDRAATEVELVLEQAHQRAEEEDWEGMAVLLQGALELHSADPYVLCWLGVAERELGLEGTAYERFRACLAQQPEDPQLLATAGSALAALADPDAEPALRTAAMLAPHSAFTRWMYGAYLSREGFLEESLRELQAARDLDPEEAGVAYELGVSLALAGNHEGAVDELYRATELDPADGWTRVVLGLALLEEGRDEEAALELEIGARGRPDDAEAQLLAALANAGIDADLAWELLERSREAAVGSDAGLVEEVEEKLDEGPESARAFLVAEIAPGAYRERLNQRP